MATKSERFAVRLTPEQDALIRRAAEIEGTDLTTFTACATVAHARDVLAATFDSGNQVWTTTSARVH